LSADEEGAATRSICVKSTKLPAIIRYLSLNDLGGRSGMIMQTRIEELLRPAAMSWIAALRSPDLA
jgi:hypothetical protein